ncbi:hypothetical protein GGR57DRAFT_498784 [Xylariaceae sp. FL1272]|nr:hypothetical protein GGR57DRAFT_498784 [Xylariaceae sp. FL1272]
MGRSTVGKSYLPIVLNCDNFPYDVQPSEVYYQLFLAGDSQPHGYMLPKTVADMPWTSSFIVSHDQPRSVTVQDSSHGSNSVAAFTSAFKELVDLCVEKDIFRVIDKQHSELFPLVSYPSASSTASSPTLPISANSKNRRSSPSIAIERYAAALFGITQQGSHMIAFVRSRATEEDSGVISGLWIPRRAAHIWSSPNMLDATVAGGVTADLSPLETIIKEAGEEASIPPELVRTRIRSTGMLTYVSVTDPKHGWPGESGLVIPDMLYTYEIELPNDVEPKPHDGEVGSFKLMNVGAVQSALLAGEFKPDAALVVIDFLIRHGVITAENEKDFVHINMHLHRRLPFRVASG